MWIGYTNDCICHPVDESCYCNCFRPWKNNLGHVIVENKFYLMEFWNISEVINGGIGPAPNWKKTTNNSTNTTDIFEEISVTSPVSVPVPFVTLSTEVSFAASNDEFSAGKQTKITAVDIQLINIPLKILEFSQRFLVKIILVAAKMSPTSVT